jgi:hypothetical protein
MSACITPVAPNFQDPPSTPDSPPYLSDFSPKNFNDVVTVPVPAGEVFSATVSDPDIGDTLNVRWVVDYPPYTNATRLGNQMPISPSSNGQPINQQVSQTVYCNLINSAVPPSDGKHQLELIVADRAFSTLSTLTPDNVLDSIDDSSGFVVRAAWTIVISCQATTSSTSSSP